MRWLNTRPPKSRCSGSDPASSTIYCVTVYKVHNSLCLCITHTTRRLVPTSCAAVKNHELIYVGALRFTMAWPLVKHTGFSQGYDVYVHTCPVAFEFSMQKHLLSFFFCFAFFCGRL